MSTFEDATVVVRNKEFSTERRWLAASAETGWWSLKKGFSKKSRWAIAPKQIIKITKLKQHFFIEIRWLQIYSL